MNKIKIIEIINLKKKQSQDNHQSSKDSKLIINQCDSQEMDTKFQLEIQKKK